MLFIKDLQPNNENSFSAFDAKGYESINSQVCESFWLNEIQVFLHSFT